VVIFIVGCWIAGWVKGLSGRIFARRKVDPTIVSFVGHLTYIAGDEAAGLVDKIEVFRTTLTTLDNKVVIIPKAKIMGDSINYSTKEDRRVDLDFGMSYSDDIDKVGKCIRDVIHNERGYSRSQRPQFSSRNWK
jgi:Mechanosensitive ion channel, beta-domain